MADPATTTPDQGDKPGEQKTSPRAHLYLVLECDRPRAAGARYDVTDIDEVIISRGSARHARRESQGGVRRLLLHVPGSYLSSLHARFLRLGSDWFIEDAHSTNGTFLNGERVTRQSLGSGDIVELAMPTVGSSFTAMTCASDGSGAEHALRVNRQSVTLGRYMHRIFETFGKPLDAHL